MHIRCCSLINKARSLQVMFIDVDGDELRYVRYVLLVFSKAKREERISGV